MEKEPNKEKLKYLKDKCNNCNTVYKLTDSTAYGINYPKKPECRHLMCRCPKCEFVTIIFIPETSNSMDTAQKTGVPIHDVEWPSDDIYESWLHVMDITLPEYRPLTDRQESLVTNYGRFLQELVITAEDFV